MSFIMEDKFDSQMMKNNFEGNFEKNLNDEVMKTLVVEILGKVGSMKEMMKEQFENMNKKIVKLEEELSKKTFWKQYRTEEDFRDATLACEDSKMKTHKVVISDEVLAEKTIRKECSESRDFRDMTLACEDSKIQAHKTVQSSDSETWAKKLFTNQKKEKVVVQGNAKIEGEIRQGWRSSNVEFFIKDCSIETSEIDVKEAAEKIAKVELLEVEKKTKEGATYGSFRIKVRKEDSWLVKNYESWPPGWRIRNFYRNYKVNKDRTSKELEKAAARTKLKNEKLEAARLEMESRAASLKLEEIAVRLGTTAKLEIERVEKEKRQEIERVEIEKNKEIEKLENEKREENERLKNEKT